MTSIGAVQTPVHAFNYNQEPCRYSVKRRKRYSRECLALTQRACVGKSRKFAREPFNSAVNVYHMARLYLFADETLGPWTAAN